MPKPSICILTHEHHRFANAKLGDAFYIASDLAKVWRDRGHRVDVLRGLPADRKPIADVCLLHLDVTRIPPDYLEFARSHEVSINTRCPDVSKRAVSRCLLSRTDEYDRPVIVKTDLNYGGMGEGQVRRRNGVISKLARRARNRLPWAFRDELDVMDYRVFDRLRDVPRPVWWNRALVVERLHTEFRDGRYWLRTWVFLGDRSLLRFMRATDPLIKGMRSRDWVFADPADPERLPDSVRERRQELGIEFGKIDYICAEDGPHVIDVNRTVTSRLKGENRTDQAQHLADGLSWFLKDGPRAEQAAPSTVSPLISCPQQSCNAEASP